MVSQSQSSGRPSADNMAWIKIVLLVAAVAAVTAFPYREFTKDEEEVFNAVDAFALKFHKVAFEVAGKKSVVASPLAIQLLLSLYATGTDGALRQELVETLHLGDVQKIATNFGGLSNQLTFQNRDVLSLTNRLYTLPTFDPEPLVESFSKSAQAFKYDVGQLNFTNQVLAADTINEWVAKETHNHITKAVSESDIPQNTVLALLNVIFFQGHWNVPFKAADTKDYDFHVDKDNVVKKPMMTLRRSFHYSDNKELNARLLELPYQETDFRMIVVLPNEVDGLQSVIEKLALNGLRSSVKQMYAYPNDIHLKMPKFEIDHKMDLNSILPKVGVSKIFSEPASGILKGNPVRVGKGLQKAFVKVDEEGATAGAFTGFFAVPMSSNYRPPPPIDFFIDRPFFFAILHEDAILFTGSYVQ